jgi:hypothetical protein
MEKVCDFLYICTPVLCNAQMAKLVDALLSGGSAARCAGSSPVLGTNFVRGGVIAQLVKLVDTPS